MEEELRYHHILTLIYAWYSHPITPGFNRYGIFLNFFVHAFMYSWVSFLFFSFSSFSFPGTTSSARWKSVSLASSPSSSPPSRFSSLWSPSPCWPISESLSTVKEYVTVAPYPLLHSLAGQSCFPISGALWLRPQCLPPRLLHGCHLPRSVHQLLLEVLRHRRWKRQIQEGQGGSPVQETELNPVALILMLTTSFPNSTGLIGPVALVIFYLLGK